MTEPATLHPEADFLETWTQSCSSVLAQILGSECACTTLAESPAGFPQTTESDLWILCTCSGGVRGEMSFRIPAAATVRLAQTFMSEAAAQADVTSEHREAALELLRQIAGLVTTALKPRWGEVQLRLDPAAAPPSWKPAWTAWIRAGADQAGTPVIEVQLSAALVAGLRQEHAGSTQAAPPPLPVEPDAGDHKLDLLLDVELGVTLRLGSQQLLLREVLDLNPGSVVSLDRNLQDPVEMLLDGRLLARGELVVMDGNYGLRVTEIAPVASDR